MDPSPALDTQIREQVEKLEKVSDQIIACRVVVEQLHRHKQQGNHFNVRVQIRLPGTDLVAGHEHEDVYMAARNALRAARRRQEEFIRQAARHT